MPYPNNSLCLDLAYAVYTFVMCMKNENVLPYSTFFPDLSISCSQCSRMFKSKMLLTRHNSIVHSDSNLRPFACTFCNMKFKSNNNLRVRLLLYSNNLNTRHTNIGFNPKPDFLYPYFEWFGSYEHWTVIQMILHNFNWQ
jgi:hypothetical protein